MTIDELVAAAAEAGHRTWMDSPQPVHGKELWEQIATAALQAAFAKLGECEAAVEAMAGVECGDAARRLRPPCDECSDRARSALAALAQEFGGRK